MGFLSEQDKRVLSKEDRRILKDAPEVEVEIIALSEVKRKKVPWLWAGRIPLGAISLFTGDSGAGKTTFTAWLIAQITTGRLSGDLYDRPGNVLYFAHEDSPQYTLAPRMEAAGADMKRVHIINANASGLAVPSGIPGIRQAIEATNASVIVFDPILSFMNIRDENKKIEVRSALNPLAKLLDETGVAGLCIHHPNKATTQNLGDRAAGSAAFREVARSTLNILRDPDTDKRYVGVEMCNLGGKQKTCAEFSLKIKEFEDDGSTASYLVREGTVGNSIYELYDRFQNTTLKHRKEAADVQIMSKQDRVGEEIDKLLEDGELTRQTIVEIIRVRCSVSVRTIDKALATSRYRGIQRKDEDDGIVRTFYRIAS